MDLDDERLPDLPGDGSHTHSLAACDHYQAGAEIGWLCGHLPMFSRSANLPLARIADQAQAALSITTPGLAADPLVRGPLERILALAEAALEEQAQRPAILANEVCACGHWTDDHGVSEDGRLVCQRLGCGCGLEPEEAAYYAALAARLKQLRF